MIDAKSSDDIYDLSIRSKEDYMSFLDNDFPHTTFYDSDLTELLEMYKKLIDDYKTLIISISDLEKKYETIDEKIDWRRQYGRF